jgi:hypothetical protein
LLDCCTGLFGVKNDKGITAEYPFSISETVLTIHPVIASGSASEEDNQRVFEAIISFARENYLRIYASDCLVYNWLRENADQYLDIWDQNCTD